MTEKKSSLSIILGSAVISAVVSVAYNHFFITKKDLLERELNFVTTLNTILKEQDEKDEHGRLTFVTNVLHPIYKNDDQFAPVIRYYMRAKTSNTEDESGQIGNNLDSVLTSELSPIADSTVLQSLQEEELFPSDTSVEDFRKGLFSGYRRQYSDKLVNEINKSDTDLPDKLIDAIITDDPKQEYRVNLYIAYTLARTPKWSASAESYQELLSLKSSPNYNDETFKKHLDEAISKYNFNE